MISEYVNRLITPVPFWLGSVPFLAGRGRSFFRTRLPPEIHRPQKSQRDGSTLPAGSPAG